MSERELTEAEIMKALEIHGDNSDDCVGCPLINSLCCTIELTKAVIDLINRKNAEIERLKKMKSIGTTDWLTKGMSAEQIAEKKAKAIAECNAEIRAEAIKEFAERVKEKTYDIVLYGEIVPVRKLDQIAKEMGVEL